MNLSNMANQIYQHIRSKARFNPEYQVIVLPTINQVKYALNLKYDEVEECFVELEDNGLIQQYSEKQYVPGLQFCMTDDLRKKIALNSRS